MSQAKPPAVSVTIANAIAVALLAALAEQVLHEVTHGVAALAVGKRWVLLNLFAVHTVDAGAPSSAADAVVSASAALVNIVTGGVAIALFRRTTAARHALWRLFWMYFAAFSIFAGFGYLMVDPLFYQPGDAQLGDWKKIVDLLGGGIGARLPIIAVGAAGTLVGFLWVPRAVMKLGDGRVDRAARVQRARSLLLIPYLVVCAVLTILAIWHPLGANGLVLMAIKYWMGYSGMFWGFLIAGYWARHDEPIEGATPLPARISAGWSIATAVALVVAVAVLLPTVELP